MLSDAVLPAYRSFDALLSVWLDVARLPNIGGTGNISVFRQPRIQTGQYLDKYCFNQSESRQIRT